MPAVVYVTTVPNRPVNEHQPPTTCQPTRSRYGGTGVIISDNGTILTSAHVVEDATAVTVTLADGSEHPVQRVTMDPKYDLAVLFTGASGLRPLRPAAQGTAEGAAVVALCGPKPGRALRPGKRARVGQVEGTSRSLQHLLAPGGARDYSNLIETTAVLDPGFSGGPLLDANGHLVGINVAAITKNTSHGPRGYAIPVNRQTIKSFELAGFESHPHFLRTEGGNRSRRSRGSFESPARLCRRLKACSNVAGGKRSAATGSDQTSNPPTLMGRTAPGAFLRPLQGLFGCCGTEPWAAFCLPTATIVQPFRLGINRKGTGLLSCCPYGTLDLEACTDPMLVVPEKALSPFGWCEKW